MSGFQSNLEPYQERTCPECGASRPICDIEPDGRCWQCVDAEVPRLQYVPTCGGCGNETSAILDGLCRPCWEKAVRVRKEAEGRAAA